MTGAKAALRLAMRTARGAISADLRARAHAGIVASLVDLSAQRGARVVALYAGSPDEADPSGAARGLVAAGCRVVWPRVAGPGLLEFHDAPISQLAPGFRGILEPPAGAPSVPWAAVDLAVVPGLAFTPDGQRLGQGGGFYDRLLGQSPRPFAVGVAYALQLVGELPSEAHDEPVDRVLTEQGFAER
ncbi:MAG: 5-formyltetrahydrofolate cyclo-ligase [Myxococcota bacterium]